MDSALVSIQTDVDKLNRAVDQLQAGDILKSNTNITTKSITATGDITLNGVSIKSKLESITGVMHFLGKALSMPTTSSVTLSTDTVVTAQAGDIILYESKEFIWDGTGWSELGDVTDYVTKTVYDAKVLELTNANTALESRIKALEEAFAAIGTLTITESDNTLTVQ
jgi:hypothetical protein